MQSNVMNEYRGLEMMSLENVSTHTQLFGRCSGTMISQDMEFADQNPQMRVAVAGVRG